MVTFNPTGENVAHTIERHRLKRRMAELARRVPASGDEWGILRELVNLSLAWAEHLGLDGCRTNRAVLRKLALDEREGC